MRCIVGFVLFVALCYGGIKSFNSVMINRTLANDPALSQRAAEDAAWKVVKEYHGYVYAAAGVLTLVLCSLPSLLDKQGSYNQQGRWREEVERRVAEREDRLGR